MADSLRTINNSNGYSVPPSSAPRAHRCPIKGCNLTFAKGTVGWAKHVGSADAHPYWHTDVQEAEVRRRLFEHEFPEFFEGTRHFISRTPPPPPSGPSPSAPVQSGLTVEQVKAAIREVLQEALERL